MTNSSFRSVCPSSYHIALTSTTHKSICHFVKAHPNWWTWSCRYSSLPHLLCQESRHTDMVFHILRRYSHTDPFLYDLISWKSNCLPLCLFLCPAHWWTNTWQPGSWSLLKPLFVRAFPHSFIESTSIYKHLVCVRLCSRHWDTAVNKQISFPWEHTI